MKKLLLPLGFILSVLPPAFARPAPESDRYSASGGDIVITFLGHGTLMIDAAGTIIHIDPVKQYGDYKTLPKADIILVTHEHSDHLDKQAIADITKTDTAVILNKGAYDKLKRGTVMANGESRTLQNIVIQAVPAYNITKGRDMYHPMGRDNGYVLTALGKRIYIAGDTEDIPERAE